MTTTSANAENLIEKQNELKIESLKSMRYNSNGGHIENIERKLAFYDDNFEDFLIKNDLLDNYLISLFSDQKHFEKYLENLNNYYSLDQLKEFKSISILRKRYVSIIEKILFLKGKIINKILKKYDTKCNLNTFGAVDKLFFLNIIN